MNILLAFIPFIIFAVLDRLLGPTQGLIGGAAASVALLARDWVRPGRVVKILEVGTTVLFGALALYAVFAHPSWSIIAVRLAVDAGLLVIVLLSMAMGKPFTLQYAREKVAKEHWDSPAFLRTNYVITSAWALAFAVMVLAELALLYRPSLSPRIGMIAIVLALVAAVKFTGWYPAHAAARTVA
jgi:hypothetical protein